MISRALFVTVFLWSMSCTFAEPADSPIKADLSSADNSNQAIKSAVKRGSESAQHDIEKKTFRILYFGEPWSMGKPLVDDTTGFPILIVGGCVVTKAFVAEVDAYNTTMREWWKKNKKQK